MAPPIVADELWQIIEPLIPPEPPKPKGGRPRIPGRKCLAGILFVLRTGLPWEDLPQELGCGSGMTCWRRLRDWNDAGVWHRLQEELLAQLRDADQIDWTRAAMDASIVPATRGARRPGRIRRIAANRARSAILFPTPAGSRSRSFSRQPTSTRSHSANASSTRSRRSAGRSAARAGARRNSTRTEATARGGTSARSGGAASRAGSRGRRSIRVSASGGTGGSWSAPSRGSIR